MTRKEFIQKSLVTGAGLSFFSMFLESCSTGNGIMVPELPTNYPGKVLIVGAGAAGIAAGYLLRRYNIDFQIVEASTGFGGRVKRAADFVDFPIDLGAEWIHTSPTVLADIIDNPDVEADIEFITYNPQTIQTWNKGKLRSNNFARNFYSEYKFKHTTWYGFFEQYLVPDIADMIVYNTPIVEIDYSSDKVRLKSDDNQVFEADKVLVTIPIKVLQDDIVTFVPALPPDKTAAINSIFVGDGLKVFIEFAERFYPDLLLEGGLLQALSEDSKVFYDAAFRKDSERNVLGLFTINEDAARYTNLGSEEEIIKEILAELDEMFDGEASRNYLQHRIQNWSAEPYIRGAYSYTFDEDQEDTVNTLLAPLDNKIYFAGEALSIDAQAMVHGACESAYSVVGKLLSE